jgi:ring-1,2-phenylacetyl-CoA epoxidase subunit PaaD
VVTMRPGLREERIWEALAEVPDPEIPALSVVDLGVIGAVEVDEAADRIRVELLPTFVGCPAIEVMRDGIQRRLSEMAGSVEVEVSFRRPWTSDRITPAGRERLRGSGFAPPAPLTPGAELLPMLSAATCPYCASRNTTLENPFGPTLCRAIYYCNACRQPFEQFKQI